MVAEWYLELGHVGKRQFAQAAKAVGLESQRGTYRNQEGIEVRFTPEDLTSRLVIRGSDKGYEAMKRTAQGLATQLPFRTITGDGFYDLSSEPIPYTPTIFEQLASLQ